MSKETNKGTGKVKEKTTLTKYNVILAILLVAIEIIAIFASSYVYKSTQTSSDGFLKSASASQLQMVEEFVSKQEERLISYSKSKDTLDILKAYKSLKASGGSENLPEYSEARKSAQKYIESISKTRSNGGNDEGIYIALMDTEVLAHTNASAVGKPFREGEALTNLQENLKTKGTTGVYCAGILISPVGEHDQVLAIYKAVYDPDTNEILGFVGMGIYVDTLEKTLGLSIEGVPSAEFSMINVPDNRYIFNENMNIKLSKVNEDGTISYEYKEVEDAALVNLSNNYATGHGEQTGVLDGDGKVSYYAHNSEYNWLFVITCDENEVYSTSLAVRHFMYSLIPGIFIVGIVILFINRRMINLASAFSKSIKKNASIGDALQESIAQDMLTGAYSRGAFYSEYAKKGSTENPVYFVQYCLSNMRIMNETITASKTDEYLITVANKLQEIYGEKNVYRVSEKEFVCTATGSTINTESVFNNINQILHFMRTPFMANDVNFIPEVDAAVIRQQKNINVSVLTALKTIEVMNKPTQLNNIPLVDRD